MAIKRPLDFFTPSMKAAGIRLFPSGSTPPIGLNVEPVLPDATNVRNAGNTLGRGLQFSTPESLGFNSVAGETPQGLPEFLPTAEASIPQPGGRSSASQGQTLGQSLVEELSSVPTVREFKTSRFGPPVKLSEPEQFETFAEDVQDRGGLLSNLGKALTSPIFAKTLAGIGEAISGKDALSDLAFDLAESNAARRFEKQLDTADSSTPASAISSPGLSRAGRERILEKRRVGGLQERQETRLEGEAQTRARAENRLGEAHVLELQKLQTEIATGVLDLGEAQELAAFSKKLRDAGPQTSEEIFTETFRILDLEIPEDVDFGGLPFEDALSIAKEMNKKALALIRSQAAGKTTATEAEKGKLREGIRLNFLAVSEATAGFNQFITKADKLADLRTEFAEAGGDPLELDELLEESQRAGPQKLGERGRAGTLSRAASSARARKLLDKNK